MKTIITKAAGMAAAGAMALGVLAPATVALAQTVPVPVPTSNNYYVLGGANEGYGYGGWGGWGGCGGGPLCPGNLGQAFVLGNLFAGPYGNGVISPYGTTLGDLLILNQIFNNGWYGFAG